MLVCIFANDYRTAGATAAPVATDLNRLVDIKNAFNKNPARAGGQICFVYLSHIRLSEYRDISGFRLLTSGRGKPVAPMLIAFFVAKFGERRLMKRSVNRSSRSMQTAGEDCHLARFVLMLRAGESLLPENSRPSPLCESPFFWSDNCGINCCRSGVTGSNPVAAAI